MLTRLIAGMAACTLLAAAERARDVAPRQLTPKIERSALRFAAGEKRRASRDSARLRKARADAVAPQAEQTGGTLNRRAADGCPVIELGPGAQQTGSLAETDCAAADLLGPLYSGRVDLYSVTMSGRGALRVTAESAVFTPLVLVVDAAEGVIIARGFPPQGSRRIDLMISVDPAEYLVVVTGSSPGEYTIGAATERLRACEPRQLATGEEAEGELTEDDCRRLDYSLWSTDRSPADRFRFSVDAPSVLTMDTVAAAFQPALLIYDARGRAVASGRGNIEFGTPGRLYLSVQPGTYVIELRAARPAAGTYKLKLSSEAPRRCEAVPLVAGQPLRADLTGSDCRHVDLFLWSTDGSPVDLYSMQVSERRVLTAEMKSAAFDTTLELYDSDMAFIEFADDFDDSTDTHLRISVEPGRYYLVAGVTVGSDGPYELSIASDPVRPCEITRIGTEETRSGVLDVEADCRYLDLVMFSTIEDTLDLYRVTIPRRGMLKTEVLSQQFDPVVILENLDHEEITYNDDASRETTDSLLDVLILPNDYLLAVTNATAARGTYDIRTSFRDARVCPTTDLAADGSSEGDLNGSDCRLSEVVPFLGIDAPADVFVLALTEPRDVTFEVSAAAIAPSVIVQDSDYRLRGYWVNFVAEPSGRITLRLGRGRYEVIATAVGTEGGAYSLRTTSAAPPGNASAEPPAPSVQRLRLH